MTCLRNYFIPLTLNFHSKTIWIFLYLIVTIKLSLSIVELDSHIYLTLPNTLNRTTNIFTSTHLDKHGQKCGRDTTYNSENQILWTYELV